MRIVVTGSAGYFGGVLMPALAQDPRVTSLVGVDRVAGPQVHHQLDLATASPADWAPVLDGADAVIHLAFMVAHHPGEDTRATNDRGQRVFLEAACAAPRRVIVASAIGAYGFAPGRDPHHGVVDERSPLHRNTRVAYAEQKQDLEALLDELAARHPATIVRARPTNVVGPTMAMRRAPLLTGPMMVVPSTRHPIRQQLLHEDDLATAFLALLDAPAGAYNLGPDDWLTLEEAAKITGQGLMRLPPIVMRGLADVAWRTGQSPFDASWLAFFEHPPIIVSNAKLRGLGWTPRWTTASALAAIAPLARRAVVP